MVEKLVPERPAAPLHFRIVADGRTEIGEPGIEPVPCRMIRIGADLVQDALQLPEQLIVDLPVHELRQPPWAAILDAFTNAVLVAFQLFAAELHQVIHHLLRVPARRDHVQRRLERRGQRRPVQGRAQYLPQGVSQLGAVGRVQQPHQTNADVAAQVARIVAFAKPLADPCGQVHPLQPRRHRFPDQEVVADEIRQHAADLVLARGHDGGMRDRQPQRTSKQRGDREPVRQRADEPGFGECLNKAQPWVAGKKQARGDEQRRHGEQKPRGDPAHPRQAARHDRFGVIHCKAAAISACTASAACRGLDALRIGRPITIWSAPLARARAGVTMRF